METSKTYTFEQVNEILKYERKYRSLIESYHHGQNRLPPASDLRLKEALSDFGKFSEFFRKDISHISCQLEI